MTDRPLPRSRVLLVVGLSAAFALLAHLALADALPARIGAVLSLLPLAALLIFGARRSGGRAAAFGAVALVAAAAIAGWEELQRHFPDLFFLEHAGMNLALAILFGRTLAGAREPLCTRFARLIHGSLAPEVERYTRGVTLAWALFFVAMFAASCTLYLGGFLATWSLFANILTPVFVVTLFVIEYAVRLRALPNHDSNGILGGVRAFSRHVGASRFEPNR